jgi:hypothetical protein
MEYTLASEISNQPRNSLQETTPEECLAEEPATKESTKSSNIKRARNNFKDWKESEDIILSKETKQLRS